MMMWKQRSEVVTIFALVLVLTSAEHGQDQQQQQDSTDLGIERFAARRSRLRNRDTANQPPSSSGGGTSTDDQTFFEPLNSTLNTSRRVMAPISNLADSMVNNNNNNNRPRRRPFVPRAQVPPNMNLGGRFSSNKRYPLYNLESSFSPQSREQLLRGTITRVRKSAGPVSQGVVEAPTQAPQQQQDLQSTPALAAGNNAAITTAAILLGQMNKNVTAVIVEPDPEQSGSSNEGYTSLDSPPDKVRVTNIGPFNFLLRWQKLSKEPGQPVSYIAEITYVETPGCDGPDCAGNYSAVPAVQLITKENSSAQDQQWMIGKSKRVDQGLLRPYSRYRVRLQRKIGDAEPGLFSSGVEVFTSPSVPDRPQNVQLRPVQGQIIASWDFPKPYPGPMNYSIHVLFWNGCPEVPNVTCDCKKTKGGQDKIVVPVTAEEQVKRRKVLAKEDCILENSEFNIQVQATTSAGAGLLSLPQNVSTSPSAALTLGIPDPVSDLIAQCRSDQIKLLWKPPISTNGILTRYEVKVEQFSTSEDDPQCDQPGAEKLTVYGPHFMDVNCSSAEGTDGTGPCYDVDYTVKDLVAGHCYEGTVVAIGELEESRSPETKASCYLAKFKSSASSSTGTLIGGIIGGLVGLAVFIAIGVVVWRRVAAPRMNEPMKIRLSGMGRTPSNQFGYARAKPTQPARESQDSVKDVKMRGQDNLAHENDDLVEIKRKLEAGEVADEFEMLCAHGPKLDANERAFARTSLSKNRYVNVLPFERTRVKLFDGENDYINASYVQGETHAREYIATQLPKLETIRDFWMMIWQEEVTTIAMIAPGTKGVNEDQIPPGFQYWPKLEVPMKFDSVTVYKMEDNSIKTGSGKHTVRVFVLEKGTETRSVTQLQFEEWPTVGVPEDTKPLNDFVVALKQQNDYHVKADGRKPPILVHCSAGSGRTGVVIALDRLRQQYKSRKSVDVAGTVHSLRKCRVHLVQTQDQYAFLYKCVVQMIEDYSTNVTVDFQ